MKKKIKNKEKCDIHNIFHNTFTTNAKYQVVAAYCWWQKKKKNYSDIFKQKTKSSLKFRICYKKYCECCTSKKKE